VCAVQHAACQGYTLDCTWLLPSMRLASPRMYRAPSLHESSISTTSRSLMAPCTTTNRVSIVPTSRSCIYLSCRCCPDGQACVYPFAYGISSLAQGLLRVLAR